MDRISGTTITLTRGDTFKTQVSIEYADGYPYEAQEGDSLRFAMKKTYDDHSRPILYIPISMDSLVLHILPEQTKNLDYGSYVYDIQLTTADGDVYTIIDRATLTLTEEVD